jgi:ATP-dependent helicase/nuclease subunit B
VRHLQDRFSPQQEFSATQLEGYATCPFRFWASEVLKVREVDSPSQFTDFGRRGDIVHEILLQLHSQLEPTPDAIPAESAVEMFRKLLVERLSQEVAGSELHAALIRIEQRLLDEWGHEYAGQWANYHEALREGSGTFLKPAMFEVSFGTPHQPDPDVELRPYLTLGSANAETRIRGRIDRIDVGEVSGQPVFNIIDYKTGRKPSTTATQMTSGRSLQLVLYALATQRLNLVGDNSLPLQAGYWCLRETGWTPVNKAPKAGPDGLVPHADWLALVDVLDELVPKLAAGIRAGHFPVYNSDPSCMSYCPYRTTCRVSQIRPLEESLAKHWEPT